MQNDKGELIHYAEMKHVQTIQNRDGSVTKIYRNVGKVN